MTLKRVVVDSSGWIELFTGGGQAEHFLALMADERSLVVPAITIFEVFQWVLREHGEAQAIQAVAVMQGAQVVDQGSRLALAAAPGGSPAQRCAAAADGGQHHPGHGQGSAGPAAHHGQRFPRHCRCGVGGFHSLNQVPSRSRNVSHVLLRS